MTELDIIHTEARIKQVKAIIADTRKNSTGATRANDEEAIQELAIPELRKAERRLAELKASSEKVDKFLDKLEARHNHLK
jgi:hypothetical protein